LRRAANGIVRILAESQLPLTLGQVAFAAAPPYTSAPGKDEPLVDRMELFFAERLDFYLREARSQTYDVVKAVLAASADDPRDAVARAEALTAVRGSEDFAAVSAAFKRTRNILSQAAEKGIAFGSTLVGLKLTSPAEEALLAKTTSLHQLVLERRTARDYIGALEAIATLRPQIDAFFDSVLIMDPDESVRHTRLTILNWLELGFSGIADFSEIVTTG
jgi:glycyl-tRNA synthetase beta chain